MLKYRKYHGCLNEFICMDLRDSTIDIAKLTPFLCLKQTWPPHHQPDKNYIGADGLVCVKPSDVADFKMVIINADGSIPEMCGNGLRCFAAFLHHEQLTNKPSLSIETGAGILAVTIHAITETNATISVEMGQAKTKENLPVSDFLPECQLSNTIRIGQFDVIPIGMGNPHAVIFTQNIDSLDISSIGPLIQHATSSMGAPWFPNGVNVEFVECLRKDYLHMRVFERGVGETMACGTGACASVVAGMHHNYCGSDANVMLRGGTLTVHVNPKTDDVRMRGPAHFMHEAYVEL